MTLKRSRDYAEPERALVARLSEVLSKDGWDVRHSVRFDGLEIDLVGVRQNERGENRVIAVEAKESVTIDLYGKALIWRTWANYVAVAVSDKPFSRPAWAV